MTGHSEIDPAAGRRSVSGLPTIRVTKYASPVRLRTGSLHLIGGVGNFLISSPNSRPTCSFWSYPATHWMYGKGRQDARRDGNIVSNKPKSKHWNRPPGLRYLFPPRCRGARRRLPDIMYQLWKSYPQFKWESKFSTWMYRVALNTAITHIRRSTRAPRNAELTEAVAIAPHISEHV